MSRSIRRMAAYLVVAGPLSCGGTDPAGDGTTTPMADGSAHSGASGVATSGSTSGTATSGSVSGLGAAGAPSGSSSTGSTGESDSGDVPGADAAVGSDMKADASPALDRPDADVADTAPMDAAADVRVADAGARDAASADADGGTVAHAGPPMGFNPYNSIWCNPSETQMRAFADAMVTHGMQAAGYQYVNVDCAWQGSRNSSGVIQAASTFPSGMKALADYVHGKGFKFGIYTAPGAMTCDNKPGSQGHETQDVNTYASWGVDYIKLDWCGADYSASGAAALAQKWKSAVAASGRPMVLSINAGGSTSVAPWASTRVNMWRVGDDICDTWLNKTGARNRGTSHCTSTTAQSGIYDYLTTSFDYLGPYSGSGHWGDPDMLQVGNAGLSLDEAITHFSIWAMWSAPLIAGNDTTKMNGSDIASKVLLNTEVIAIDQDPANAWATRVKNTASLQVYKKALAASGTYAVALVNMSGSAAPVTLSWSDLGLTSVTSMRDLWAHADITPSGSGYTATSVPSHGTVLLKLTGK